MRFATIAFTSVMLLAAGGCDGCGQAKPTAPAATGSAAVPASASPDITPPFAPVPKKCKARCMISGHCGWYAKANRCVARGEEDCKKSRTCRVNGLCTFRGGNCLGGSDDDCKASERCKNEGLCKARPTSHMVATNCYAATDEHCQQSKLCTEQNRCTATKAGFCDNPDNPRKTPAPEGSADEPEP